LQKPTPAQAQKARRLQTTYKQTPEDREAILKEQKYRCCICDRPFGDGDDEYMAFQDHDHECCPRKLKQFCGKCCRGLLCFICNKKVIALLERIEKMNANNPEYQISIERAIEYLRKWKPILIARGAYAAKGKEKRLRKK
jgi:hypothetical protein